MGPQPGYVYIFEVVDGLMAKLKHTHKLGWWVGGWVMEEAAILFEGGGDSCPLLSEENPKRPYGDERQLDSQGSPFSHCKTSDWRAPAIILGFEFLESLGFSSIAANLVIYLGSILHESNASIAMSVTTWTGTCYLTPFLGALVADSYWGSYRMIFSSSLIYLGGMVTILLSASLPSLKPPPCGGNACPSATDAQKLIFYSGLYLIAFGGGGVKSSLLPLGADQFNDENPEERAKKGSFFNRFYFCINVGILISSTLIVWIEENIDWAVGFGIATLCIAFAVGGFVGGKSTYRLREPRGSPLKRVLQVFVASLQKFNVRAPTDSSQLYEMQDNDFDIRGAQRLSHTDEFRFLDKAATMTDFDTKSDESYSPWSLCTMNQVEEVKIVLRLFPIWVTGIIYSVAYAQLGTTFVEQGRAMDTKIGSFSVPPASLSAFEVLSVMACVLLYDSIIVRLARSSRGLTQLQRMGIGHLLMIIAMAMAAIMEVKRLKGVRSGEPLSIMWQLPLYFTVGCSEVFGYVSQLEFFYDQGPATMRSMSIAVSMLTISLGNYLSSLVVTLIAFLTARGGRPGWIPEDLNEGHLDYFFLGMLGLGVVNFITFLACAMRYRLKNEILGF